MNPLDDLDAEQRAEFERIRRERMRINEEIRKQTRESAGSLTKRAEGTPRPPGASPSPVESDEGGVLDTLGDVGTQTVAGAMDGIDAMLQLPFDLVGSDVEVDLLKNIAPSENVSGQLARGIGQFGVGMIPGVSVVRTLGYATKGLKAAQAARSAVAGSTWKTALVKGSTAGAVADFVAFDGNEQRLTDMMEDLSPEYPWLESVTWDYLISDEDDSAAEGRFKNAVEGLMIGGPIDVVFSSFMRAARNLKTSKARTRIDEFGKRVGQYNSEVLSASNTLNELRTLRGAIEGVPNFSKAELDSAAYQMEEGETLEEALARLFPNSGTALARLKEINPEVAQIVEGDSETVSGVLQNLTDMEDLYQNNLNESLDGWLKARTSPDSIDMPLDDWNRMQAEFPEGLLDERAQELIERWDKTPQSAKEAMREIDELRRGGEDLKRDAKLKERVSVFDYLSGKQHLKGTKDATRLRKAILENDSVSLARIATEAGEVLEIKLPEEGESLEDFMKSVYVATKGDEGAQKTGGRTAGKPKKNIVTEAQADKLVEDFLTGLHVEGANRKGVEDLVRAIQGGKDINLTTLPETLVAMRNLLTSAQATLLQRAGAVADVGTGTLLDQAEFDQLYRFTLNLQDALSGNITKVAQSLQALNIHSTGKATDEWFRNVRDVAGEVTDKNRSQIARMLFSADSAVELSDLVRKTGTKGPVDHVVEYFLNSILSGIHTWMIQPISGAAMTIYMPMERLAGSALRLDAKGVRAEMAGFKSLMDSFRGMIKSVAKGSKLPEGQKVVHGTDIWENTKKTLLSGEGTLDARTSFDEITHAWSSQNWGLQAGTTGARMADLLGNFIRFPGRIIATLDEVAKGFNYNLKLSRDAYEEGIALDVDDLGAHVKEYMDKAVTWENILDADERAMFRTHHDRAIEYARRATFQEDLKGFGTQIQNMTSAHPGMKLILPFVRTPTNILKFVGHRTPMLQRLFKEQREILNGTDEAAKQAVRDRMHFSTAVWGSSMVLASQGFITGGGPASRDERQAWFDAGWQPYSIWVGTNADGSNRWWSFQKGDPLGMFLGMSGDMAHIFTDSQDEDLNSEIGFAAVSALAENLKSRSYFLGLSQFMTAMENPKRFFGSYGERQLSNIVPNFFAQMRRFGPAVRDESMREVDGYVQSMMNRVPGTSEMLTPKYNIYGDIQKYPMGAGFPMINPFYVRENGITPSMLLKLRKNELDIESVSPEARVALAAVQIGFAYDMTRYDKISGVELTQKQKERYIQLSAVGLKEKLTRLVSSTTWRHLTDPQSGDERESGKYRAFSAEINESKRRGARALLREDRALAASVHAEKRRKKALRYNTTDSALAQLR
tara:strand:+ start:15104 stop:19156 length:4053 start_codon:yes stop_codon:yes gene_type:complete